MPTWITGSGPTEPIALAHTEVETPTSGKVTLRCAWANRFLVIENIFENSLIWPYHPETGWIPATFSIKATPQIRTDAVPGEQLNSYPTADIELTFGPPGSNPAPAGSLGFPGGGSEGEVLYYETYQPSGEMLKLPPLLDGKWQFRWGSVRATSDAVTPEEAPTRLIVGLDYVIRWVGLEEVPEAFFDAPDHVNSNEIESSAGKTFAPGTLLCQSPVIQRTVTTLSAPPLWEVEARFSYRKDGWNKFWNPKTATFKQLYIYEPPEEATGELYNNFPEYDFAAMLP